jgi:hypothetical protein
MENKFARPKYLDRILFCYMQREDRFMKINGREHQYYDP